MTEKENKEKPEEVKAELVEAEVFQPPAPILLRPVAPVAELVSAWKEYQELTKQLLDKTDYCNISGKPYKKKSAWRKYGKAFSLSVNVTSRKIDRNKEGDIIRAETTVDVVAPNGQRFPGYGAVGIKEKKFAHPEHDMPTLADTRAINRGISDIIGAGEVSADEINADGGGGDKDSKNNQYSTEDKAKPITPKTSLKVGDSISTEPTKEDAIKKEQITKLRELASQGDNALIVNAFCDACHSTTGVFGLTNKERKELIEKLDGSHFRDKFEVNASQKP